MSESFASVYSAVNVFVEVHDIAVPRVALRAIMLYYICCSRPPCLHCQLCDLHNRSRCPALSSLFSV